MSTLPWIGFRQCIDNGAEAVLQHDVIRSVIRNVVVVILRLTQFVVVSTFVVLRQVLVQYHCSTKYNVF